MYIHVSTDGPQSDIIGHQESSLSLRHGLCVSASLNSLHTAPLKIKARPLHLFFGVQSQTVVMELILVKWSLIMINGQLRVNILT